MTARPALSDRAASLFGVAGRREANLIILAALGVFFAADDQTSVVAVLPKMIEGVGLPQDQFFRAAWIVNGYILGYVVAMPLMGRISDVFGHGRVFAAALALFILGSIWVAVSNDLTMLAIARAVQAVGGGAVVPVAMAIVADTMPSRSRAFGLGAIAAASEAGGLIGPLDGGVVAQVLGWRAVFWENVPLCLPIALAMWRLSRGSDRRPVQPIDFLGATLLGGSLVALTFALTDDPIQRRPAVENALLYAGSAAFFVAFLGWQARTRFPLVDLRHFRKVSLTAGFLTNGLVGAALIVAMVNIPLFTNVVLGDSAIQGGVNLMRLTVAVPVGAFAGGYLTARLGPARTAVLALALGGLGFIGMSRWDDTPGFAILTAPLLAAGLGFGLVIAPVNSAVLDEVEEGERATVSSLLTVVRLIGALVGVALLTTRGLGGFYAEAGLIPLGDPRYSELLRGLELGAFRDTFVATSILCFATIVPAMLLRLGRPRGERGASEVAPVQ